jgi:hypothetical protein
MIHSLAFSCSLLGINYNVIPEVLPQDCSIATKGVMISSIVSELNMSYAF